MGLLFADQISTHGALAYRNVRKILDTTLKGSGILLSYVKLPSEVLTKLLWQSMFQRR